MHLILHQTRVLKSDFARYNLGEDDESDELDQDDNGWKIIQTDVFRFPPAKSIFCAILGTVAFVFLIVFLFVWWRYNFVFFNVFKINVVLML